MSARFCLIFGIVAVVIVVAAMPISAKEPRLHDEIPVEIPQYTTAAARDGSKPSAMTRQITARVVKVLPDGGVLLEGRQSTLTAQEICEFRLNGQLSAARFGAGQSVNCSELSELRIEERRKSLVDEPIKSLRNSSFKLRTLLPME